MPRKSRGEADRQQNHYLPIGTSLAQPLAELPKRSEREMQLQAIA